LPQAVHLFCKLQDADMSVAKHRACMATSLQVVRLLLRHGANVHARIRRIDDDEGECRYHAYVERATPLLMAASGSRREVPDLAEMLLAAGAKVDAYCDDGEHTSLMLTVEGCSLRMTHCLLRAGASPLVIDDYDECALQKLVMCTAEPLHSRRCFRSIDGALLRRADAAHLARMRGRCEEQPWPFLEDRVEIAPFIAAALITRCYEMGDVFDPQEHLPPTTLLEAVKQHGADARLTCMLRLAAARVPLTWRRGVTASFPAPFRAVVRTLLLCRARAPRARALGEQAGLPLEDAAFDAVVAHLARVDVWPSFACDVRVRADGWWWTAHRAALPPLVEHVSVLDFVCAPWQPILSD
jgi:hypothetical protein